MDNRNTIIYVRVKGKRPSNFVDPEPFEWNEDKDKQLWEFISKLDNSIDQINWTKLSTILNVPIFFLRERSYKLFENHMLLMKRQFDNKKLSSMDLMGNFEAFKDSSIIKKSKMKIPTVPDSSMELSIDKCLPENTIPENNDSDYDDYLKSDEKMGQEKLSEKSTTEVLDQLHVSKVLGKRLHSTKKKQLDELKELSDNDTSSSLSVSKSALEEALLERLHF